LKAKPTIEIPPVLLVVAVIASIYEWAVFASTFWYPGSIGPNLNAPGGDWIAFYGAARVFLDGTPDLIFDGNGLTAFLNSAFSWWLSEPLGFRPWVYPPSYLLLVLPFGTLPFIASYVIFQLATAGLLTAALCLGPDQRNAKFLLAVFVLLSPAAAFNVVGGQNAFLVSALVVAGFRVLRRRPIAAGALLGALTIKPQFCLLVPIALIAAREWRALISAIIAGLALILISIPILGIDLWVQWLRLTTDIYVAGDAKWIEYGRIWGISVYACIAAAGGSETLANAAQAAAALVAAGITYRAFRLPLTADHRLAVLLAGMLLAAPHASPGDAVLLVIAAMFWISGSSVLDPSPWKWPLTLSFWLVPLFNPPLVSPAGRFTPALIVAFILLIVSRRATYEDGPGHPACSVRGPAIVGQ
jgi:Glycosyltransferase family 87